MTPENVSDLADAVAVQVLLAEAGQAALGWAYLTVSGIAVDTQADLERYHRALDVFEEVAAGRERRHYEGADYVTFAVRGQSCLGRLRAEDADWVIAELYDQMNRLKPPARRPGSWQIQASAL